jgi:hypothetical protein
MWPCDLHDQETRSDHPCEGTASVDGVALTAERCNQLLDWAGTFRRGTPERPPSKTEVRVALDRKLLRRS